jgi:hypothetical protein
VANNRSCMKPVLFSTLVLSLVACAPKVRTTLAAIYPPLDYAQEVHVLGLSDQVPQGSTEIGQVKIGDSGFSTNCDWEVVLEKAKLEARKAGGNVIKIVEHQPPSAMGSTCHRITALILKVDDPDAIQASLERKEEIVDSTWSYAKLYVYRPGGAGAWVGFDVYLGDSVICRMRSNSKQELRITKEGMNILWAKTESRSEAPIEVEHGREYYLRCTMGMGVMVGRPHLELVDGTQGKTEYASIKER